MQRIANPPVEGIVAAHGRGIAALVSKESAPLVGKIICVIRADQQTVNELIALGRIGALKKRPSFFLCGQATRDIDGHPPDKGGVIANFRGRHPHTLELGEYHFINKVAWLGHLGHGCTERHAGLINRYLTLIADHH